ncbi:hypothetical protein SAMN04487926_14532 [Paraburkholderia steynii]|uniref:Uncharacterized protein n=1 Tax=Paraburkholderia steynii TaxID=1245441 RepID=A0A7Z7BJ58_9BURK|nr:hypothetical protein SAMN04487926_14532 [Paraburkholderia steynii]
MTGFGNVLNAPESLLHEQTRQLFVVPQELFTNNVDRLPVETVGVANHAMVRIERFEESCKEEGALVARLDIHRYRGSISGLLAIAERSTISVGPMGQTLRKDVWEVVRALLQKTFQQMPRRGN